MSDTTFALLLLFGSPVILGALFWLTRFLEHPNATETDEWPLDVPW